MGRQVLTRADVQTAPYDVGLGALDTLTPDAIFAHYNGVGAGGTFLPCVTYYTQDGKVFARAFPASSVAAGASADVSFFPGLSQAPAQAASGGDYTLIEAKTISQAPGGPIVFSAIPQTYRHLQLITDLANDTAIASDDLWITWNSGIATYNYIAMFNAAVAASSLTHAATKIVVPQAVPAALGVAHPCYCRLVLTFADYCATNALTPKTSIRTVSWHGVGGDNGTGDLGVHQGIGTSGDSIAGNNTAISSITLALAATDFEQGHAALYGIT